MNQRVRGRSRNVAQYTEVGAAGVLSLFLLPGTHRLVGVCPLCEQVCRWYRGDHSLKFELHVFE